MRTDVAVGSNSAVATLFGDSSYTPETGHGSMRLGRKLSATAVQQIASQFYRTVNSNKANNAVATVPLLDV
jgi:hypothetical protein